MGVAASLRVDLALGGLYRATVLEHAPILWWRFNSATNVTDGSGNSRTGTITGGVTRNATTTESPIPDGGDYLIFNGTTGYVSRSESLLSGAAACTFEAWIHHNGQAWAATQETVVSLGSVGHYLAVTNGVVSGSLKISGTVRTLSGGGTQSTSAWKHIALTWSSGSPIRLYVNGAVVATSAAFTGTLDSSPNPAVGAHNAASFFKGWIDEPAIYATALTTTELGEHYTAGQWTDVSSDVHMPSGVTLRYGISGNGPTDRLADLGTLAFALRNDPANSGGLRGYYSPLHANCRAGFGHGTMVRVVCTYNATEYPVFRGRVATINPVPGQYRTQLTQVTAHDLMDDLIEADLRNVALQLNQTEAQLLETLTEALPVTAQPLSLDLDTGVDTAPYAFDDLGSGAKAIGPAGGLVMSAIGFLWFDARGRLVYENRQARQFRSSSLSIVDTMRDVVIPTNLDGVFNRVRATCHPRTIDAAATTVLWAQTGDGPSIAAGESLEVWGDYYQTSNPSVRIGGTAQVTPLVATTDYTANTLVDGTGTDKTANVSVSVVPFGSSAKFTVTNNDAAAVYLTKLQIRGKGLYDHSPVTVESASSQPYGVRAIALDLPYQHNPNVAADLAAYVRTQFEALDHQATAVTFLANESADLMAAALGLGIGDRLTISETQTGLAVDAFVQSIQLKIKPGPWITCTFGLTTASYFDQVWVFDEPGLNVVGTSTYYGFA